MSFFNVFIDEFLKKENAAQARRHLGISPTPTPAPGGGNVTSDQEAALVGTSGTPSASNKYVTNSDPRNANSRVPTSHAASHSSAAADPVTVTNLAGYPGGGTTFLRDDGTFAVPPGTGAGTVTSVGLTMPTSIFDVAGSPVSTNGTLAVTLDNQNANLIFAGPATGAAAAPTMRAIVAADLPVTSQPWDVIITKSADQVVTNSVVPVDDTELTTALVDNAFYEVELLLLMSGNNVTGDYRGRFGIPTTAINLSSGFIVQFGTALAVSILAGVNSTTAWPSTDILIGGDATDTIKTNHIRVLIKTEGASGTLVWQFANAAAAAGRTSTTRAGSTLRVKRLF